MTKVMTITMITLMKLIILLIILINKQLLMYLIRLPKILIPMITITTMISTITTIMTMLMMKVANVLMLKKLLRKLICKNNRKLYLMITIMKMIIVINTKKRNQWDNKKIFILKIMQTNIITVTNMVQVGSVLSLKRLLQKEQSHNSKELFLKVMITIMMRIMYM